MRIFILVATLATLNTASGAEDARTWTSTEGKTFSGAIESASTDSVKVRREDGRTFDVPLSKLAQTDRDFVARYLQDQKRSEGLEVGPFASLIDGEWVQVPKESYGVLFQIYGASALKRLKEPFPLFIHLHGAGSRANEVETGKVEIAPQRLASEEIYGEFPCLIIVPTCPPDTNWGDHTKALENLIDSLVNSLPIDRKRIYLSGYSMGSRGIGSLIESRPHHYAAALFADGEAKMQWVDQTDTALW
ncbi:MAG: hypothetical protein AAGC68_08630, partial [Verrucomicrobiota bacterium]